MVKHNNVVPNIHCHKKYLQSSRGPLKVRLTLNQATKKKSRRLARAARAARLAPRPLQKLRPIVHCPTQKYNSKVRLGRGFTKEELKGAGLTPQYARTVGIAVDERRCNRCNESLQLNIARLQDYKNNLVVWTKKSKPSEAPAQLSGIIQPIAPPSKELVMEDVTSEMKDFKAVTTMRVAMKETKVAGYRVAVENRKKKE